MKLKFSIILLLLILFSACGSDSREEELETPKPVMVKDSIPTIKGDIIFLDSAAVIKGPDFIYGVHMDSMAFQLSEKLEPLKSDDFEMLPVTVEVKIIQNPRRDGWDEIIEIREIIATPKVVKDTLEGASEEE